MTDEAFQIIARGPRALAEAAAAAIDEHPATDTLTYSILEEDEDHDVWRIDAFPTTDDEKDALVTLLKGHEGLRTTVEKLADADWLAMALSGLPPVGPGGSSSTAPTTRAWRPPVPSTCVSRAGAAFGTGHHGTTVGCLAAFDQLLKRRRFKRVLDVGCGTGVLAIAAARTGSKVAVGTDIDGPSVRIANENAKLNHASARFVHASGLNDRLVRQDAPYDLVFANILAPPLVALAQDIKRALKPGGVAILSGLLRTQERRIIAAYASRGFRLERRLHRDAWSALVLRKKLGGTHLPDRRLVRRTAKLPDMGGQDDVQRRRLRGTHGRGAHDGAA